MGVEWLIIKRRLNKGGKMSTTAKVTSLMSVLLMSMFAIAADANKTVTMNEIDATGKVTPIGSVQLSETSYGVLFTPNLTNLPPGLHGFHLHEKPNCDNTTEKGKVVVAGAAGGHWDPEHTMHHEGPYAQ